MVVSRIKIENANECSRIHIDIDEFTFVNRERDEIESGDLIIPTTIMNNIRILSTHCMQLYFITFHGLFHNREEFLLNIVFNLELKGKLIILPRLS